MDMLARVIGWIEAGKQVGKTVFVQEDGTEYAISVAVQKWQGIYKLYICRLPLITNFYDFADSEFIDSKDISSIPLLLVSRTTIQLHELTPLKGNRYFTLAATN